MLFGNLRLNLKISKPRWIPALAVAALTVLGLLVAAASPAFAQAVTVTDLKGRQVTLARPATRVLIDDGRFLVALALIHPNPVSVVAGWPRDINRVGEATYRKFVEKFPALASLPQVASSAGTFSMEQALAVNPELAVFSLGAGPSDEQLQQFQRAGIAVAFIDFFTHPLQNLEPSLALLGQVTGRHTEAQRFLEFRKSRLNRILDRVRSKGGASRPQVFLEAHAGISADCCNSVGKGNIGDYIAAVGGHSIGADVLPGASGRLNIEFVVSRNPDVYIMTGGPHLEKPGGFVVGPGYSPERARASLTKMTLRTGIGGLPAVTSGRVFGLSHQLLNSPLDIVTVEVLAKWIQPSLFADLTPEATLAEMNAKFLAVPLEGVLWLGLRP
jgi:iron complex transport system substrate-binding protein